MKWWVLIIILLLTMYAPIELTTVIIKGGFYSQYWLEVAFIWEAYLIAMGIVLWKTARR